MAKRFREGRLDDKADGILRSYLWRRIGRLRKGYKRYRVEVVNQTVMAYYLRIDNACHWLPRDKVFVGIHPRGAWYCADIPQWLVDKHKL